jgi:hypothetical protein
MKKDNLNKNKKIGQNFAILAHSGEFNLTKNIIFPLFSNFGSKMCDVYVKNVLKTTNSAQAPNRNTTTMVRFLKKRPLKFFF